MAAKSYTLYPHQTRGSSWLQETEKRFGGGILADEMGLGKTIQIIDMMLSNPKKKNLVVAPASLVSQWQTEIHKFTSDIDVYIRPDLKTIIKSNPKRQSVYIVSYNNVVRDHFLSAIKFDRVICDEAHYFRNIKSKTFKSLYGINATIRWVITGTPIQNYKKDIITMFVFLRKENDKLKVLIRKYLLRRTVSELDFKLPGITREIKFIPNHNKDLIDTIEDGCYSHHLERIIRLKQACVIPTQTMFSLAERYDLDSTEFKITLKKLNKIITDVNEASSRKIIVFSYFKKEMEYLYQKLKTTRNVATISGSTSKVKRQQIIEDKSYDVLLIQIMAGGTGLNLQHFDTVFFSGPQWNPTIEQQAIARVYRIGQTNDILVRRYIVGTLREKSIEKRIVKIQKAKLEIIKKYFE
tara:strand:+ start:185 stop:1414 length:1230 start_codon:yes stop_codon:yes gene_type:complete